MNGFEEVLRGEETKKLFIIYYYLLSINNVVVNWSAHVDE
jgi:hypothetical protein